MANEWVCMGCMQANSEFSESCYHCGYPAAGQNPTGYLPVRTQLSSRYVIGRAMEKHGDTIVYIGYDQTAREVVLVRELFPDGLAQRLSLQVVATTGKEEALAACMESFRKQSRTLARLRELPALIPVYDMFEENGTMYTVSDRVEGVTLRQHLQGLGEYMSWEAARPLFVPLLSAVMSMHAAGLVHGAISPDTILVDGEGRLRLTGWELPEAHVAGGALSLTLVKGYAAPEQYEEGAAVGEQADVYALGATILFALTGEEPPAAIDRVNKVASLLVPADIAKKWPSHIAPTLSRALALSLQKRAESVEVLRDSLTVAPVVEALQKDALEDEKPAAATKSSSVGGMRTAVAVLAALCAALLIVVVVLLLTRGNGTPTPVGGDVVTTTTASGIPTTTTTRPTTGTTDPNQASSMYAVEDLIGLTIGQLESYSPRGNMKVVIKGTEFSSAAVGTVVMQDPSPETYAEEGTTIYVYVSAGPSQKAMLDIVGWERAAAVAYLEAMGYEVSVVEVTVSDQERDRVHAVIPDAGTLMSFGDEVVLQISMVTTTTAPSTTTTETPASTTDPATDPTGGSNDEGAEEG